MSGYLRIGGALVVGIVLILGAFSISQNQEMPQEASAIVSVTPERTYIEVTDENKNSIEDWKESLPETTATIELPQKKETSSVAATYDEPTTFTGKFAKAFFTDFMQAKSLTGEAPDQEKFIEQAVNSVENNTQTRRYSRLDVSIVPDSEESLHAYGNNMAKAFTPNDRIKENQVYILERAVKTQNPEVLKDLEPIEKAYEKMLGESLITPVPYSIADQHAALLTAIDAIRTDIDAMGKVFEDPLYALSRVKQHPDNAAGMLAVIKEISTTLLSNGVSYENDEPGALIYTITL